MRRLRKFFKTFTPAVAGGESYVDLAEQKGTYFDMALEIKKDGVLCDAATMTQLIDYVEILRNNNRQRKFTPAQLISINAFKKEAFETGFLDVFFAEPDSSTSVGEDNTAWTLDGASSFVVKIFWKAGAWVPSVEGYRSWHPTTLPLSAVSPVTYSEVQFNEVTGANRLLDIPNNGRDINHIHMFTDKISDFVYRRNDQVIIEGTKGIVDHQYKKGRDYIPTANEMVISQKAMTGRGADRMPATMVLDGQRLKSVHEVEATFSADSQFNTIIETVGSFR